MEYMVVSSVALDDFHDLWLQVSMTQYRHLTISTRAALSPGSIIFCPSARAAAFFEVANSRNLDFKVGNWVEERGWYAPVEAHGKIMEDSWIRYLSLPTQQFLSLIICDFKVLTPGPTGQP
jgi:hypothetical protein